MKTLTLTIIKKNRVYFACKHNGYDCKLRITPESVDLHSGEHELLVNDESVRTKYGTDVIYSVAIAAKLDEPKKICTFKHEPYNSYAAERCKNLGGKWDGASKTWVFSGLVEDKVEDLDWLFNSDIVTIEIKALENISAGKSPLDFAGYTISRAFGRDTGAKIGDGISMLEGAVYSGGSVKNWTSGVKKDSVFRFSISKNLLDEYRKTEEVYWEIKILDESAL